MFKKHGLLNSREILRDRKTPKIARAVRDQIRVMHDSIRTKQAYVDWIRRFILWHDKHHPLHMGKTEVGLQVGLEVGLQVGLLDAFGG